MEILFFRRGSSERFRLFPEENITTPEQRAIEMLIANPLAKERDSGSKHFANDFATCAETQIFPCKNKKLENSVLK